MWSCASIPTTTRRALASSSKIPLFAIRVPLDRLANASRKRRRVCGETYPDAEPSGLDPLALIEAEHYDRVRPVGQPSTKKTKKKEE